MRDRGGGGGRAKGISNAGHEVVKGFRLLRLPLAEGSLISRNLLVKRHQARDPAERANADRTLFVSHLDNFVTEVQLSRSFSTFGPVEQVELKSAEKRAPRAEQRADHVVFHVNFARVVFKEKASVEKALEASTGRIVGLAVLPPPPSELKEQLRLYQQLYRDPVELRKEVDTYMANYDLRLEEKRRLERETAVDEDGFTKVLSGITRTADGMVIRSTKRPGIKAGAFSEPIRGLQDLSQVEERKQKKKQHERVDFYRFQLREKKRKEIADHRKQKVADEEKILHMRKAKRFKV